jgi:hypothetical protein
MAKQIDYPRGSLRAAMQLAEAVDSFAGNCSVELAAEKLGKKISGAFAALVGATVKYGLVHSRGGKLTNSSTFREIKLAYTPQDATMHLRKAFLTPPLFRAVYDKFHNQKLPVEHFEKVLIREFNVPDAYASRIGRYFVDGAKQCGLLGTDNVLIGADDRVLQQPSSDTAQFVEGDDVESAPYGEAADPLNAAKPSPHVAENVEAYRTITRHDDSASGFRMNIRGPGVDVSLEIKELDDLEIVQVMVRKIEKALKVKNVTT